MNSLHALSRAVAGKPRLQDSRRGEAEACNIGLHRSMRTGDGSAETTRASATGSPCSAQPPLLFLPSMCRRRAPLPRQPPRSPSADCRGGRAGDEGSRPWAWGARRGAGFLLHVRRGNLLLSGLPWWRCDGRLSSGRAAVDGVETEGGLHVCHAPLVAFPVVAGEPLDSRRGLRLSVWRPGRRHD